MKTGRVRVWMHPELNALGERGFEGFGVDDICQPVITALVDVRQALREAAGINKDLNQD